MNHLYNKTYSVICDQIKQLSKEKNIIVGIDGRCGSGKTTLAIRLGKEFNASVISMDDFFLPLNLRTKNRLQKVGGNIHYERFISEVIRGLESKNKFSYRKFDCSLMDYSCSYTITPSNITIIEGSYSLHPKFEAIYDYKIFCTVSKDIQIERILKRNGTNQLEVFQAKWIPMEEKYFEAFNIESNCDVVISS